MAPRSWTCQRRIAGIRCGTVNPRRKQKCVACGGQRPAAKRPRHMVALDSPYEQYVELNGGDRCAICLRERTNAGRRLDRDHDHRTGQPRGLLCHRCNRALPSWMTAEWLRAAAMYLERAEEAA